MRSHKQEGRDTQGQFLTPTVNSYKMHLAAVKSLLPDRVIPKPLDIRLPKNLTKANVDVLRAKLSKQDCRLTMYSKNLHTPAMACVKEFTGSEHTLMPSPVTVKRGKAKRISQGADLTHAPSMAPVILNPVGENV